MSAVLRAFVAVALLLALALSWPLAAQQSTSREAQRRLEKIQRELKDVAAERRRLEGQRGAASRELRAVDERVADSSRALHVAETELAREQDSLAQLNARREELKTQQAGQRRELAALLRAAYAQGDQAPLKVMLAQDRIADAQRQMTYYGYLQRQRLQRAAALSAELDELARVETQIVEKRTALDAARVRQQAQLAALAHDRKARAVTLGELEQQYRDRSVREQALGSDAKALQQVIGRLRAAAARAAAERAAAERAAKVAATKAAAAASKANGPRSANARANGSKPATAQANPPRQIANAAPVRVGGFGWPLSGSLVAGFGGRMPDGRASSGMLIAAGLGTPVHAVADGNVVFAEWMTGYGLILIVDHGDGYLSLYAHNESLLKDVGATVKRGDAVARVGNSGGLEQPALYFELRRNGLPVDPGSWLRRQ
ncbi:MAG: peptidoglycan DD-metalloendopeptidase family protein [Lysobacteraceae bacterium]